jgi:Zn-dependent protease with chaperone function
MAFKVTWITLLLGLGIIGCGIMVFVFLVKFLFASSKADESDCIEVKEADQPQLFLSIRSIASRVGTPMPKKVLISPDVNACVFYNSSFWSMFLPVRKNLKIGLGLVNAVNISELESVIAHEFGHFSQRSMTVGSWVYQVNRIIYDMLFNNEGYGENLRSMASVNSMFELFALVTIKIVEAIQWVLRQMYKAVNKSYMGLSRQMEFHADHVAASVCGSNNAIRALFRVEFASTCYETTLGICNNTWQQKIAAADFFTAHLYVMQYTGELRQLAFEGALPVSVEQDESSNSRINYKDQWSSHPTLRERKDHLESCSVTGTVNTLPAWALFREEAALKEALTRKIYRSVAKEEVKEELDTESFQVLLKAELEKDALPAVFKGYYDQRQVEAFDVEAVAAESFAFTSFKDVFDEDTATLPRRIAAIHQDLAVLQAISDGHIETESFDFEGQKYDAKEAAAIMVQLQEELETLQEKLQAGDRRLFRYSYAVMQLTEAEALKKDYLVYFQRRAAVDRYLECVNALMEPLGPVFRGETIPIELILTKVGKLKEEHEPAFKEALRKLPESFSLPPELQGSIDKFLASDFQYFHEQSFFDNELKELANLVQECWETISRNLFEQFKVIAEMQAQSIASKELKQDISSPNETLLKLS